MRAFGFEIERTERPLFVRRNHRRVAVAATGTAIAVVMGTGLAYAAWSHTATGTATAKAGSITFTVPATTTTTGVTNTLRPGSAAGTASGDAVGGDLKVTLNNTSGFAVHIVSVSLAGLITSDKNGAGCTDDTGTFPGSVTAGNHGVSVGTSGTFTLSPAAATAAAVSSSPGDQSLVIANVLNMASTSNTNCQGATFSIPVTVTVST